MTRRARQGIAQAWERIRRYLERVRRALPRIVRSRLRKTFEELYDIVDLAEHAREQNETTRRVLEKLREHAWNEDVLQERLEALVRLLEDEQQLEDEDLKHQALLNEYRQRLISVYHRYLSSLTQARDDEEREEVRRRFFEEFDEHVLPFLAVARVAATGDPASLDVDFERAVAEAREDFDALLSAQNHREAAMAIFALETALNQQFSRAEYRHKLFAQALEMGGETAQGVGYAMAVSMLSDPRVSQALHEIHQDLQDYFARRVSPRSFLSRLVSRAADLARVGEFVAGVIGEYTAAVVKAAMREQYINTWEYFRFVRRLPTPTEQMMERVRRLGLGAQSVERAREEVEPTDAPEAAPERQDHEPHEPPQDAPAAEEGVATTYGVWVLGDAKHCRDCLSLAALTSLFPVPIDMLPVPGTETECGANCKCSVEVVSEDEMEGVLRAAWQTQVGRYRHPADAIMQIVKEHQTREDIVERYIAPYYTYITTRAPERSVDLLRRAFGMQEDEGDV